MLIYRLAVEGTGAFKQWLFWIALAMLALTLVGHFGVQPIIQSLKVQGGTAEVMQSVVANRFARWHGIASILYVISESLGLMLVIKTNGRGEACLARTQRGSLMIGVAAGLYSHQHFADMLH